MIYLFIPLSLAAFFTVYLLWIPMRRSLHARRWESHPAKVIYSNLTRQPSRLGYVYTLRVSVTYSVDIPRTTTAALPSPFGTTREGYAMRLTQFFHLGATVPVYVDPRRPDIAILLPGVELRDWLLLGLMSCTATGALFAAFTI